MFPFRVPLLCLYLFVSTGSVAQVDSSKQLPAIIITATRTKSSITKTPFSVSVLDSSKLKQSLLRTVPESLIGLSCVFVQKTNHGGGSPIVRGLTGNQNLLLIDGFRLNNAIFRYGPNQYLTLVDPFLVERIEVVKGTGSVQFGSDAMGGVINVITRQPRLSVKPVFQVLYCCEEPVREWSAHCVLKFNLAIKKSLLLFREYLAILEILKEAILRVFKDHPVTDNNLWMYEQL